MMTDLNTSVSTISSEALDQLFAGVPDTQVNADTLKVPDNGVPSNVTFDSNKSVNQQSSLDVPNIDLDNLDEVETPEKVEKPEKPEKPEKVEKAEKVEKVEIDKTETPDELESKKIFLKNSVDYLIEKKIFKDFEGREELEMDEETFSKLLEKQVEAKVDELYNSKKKSTGEYGEAILEFLENGGEPDRILDLFKERKVVEEFNISDEESQIELVEKWYKDVHGWKPEKIKKYINTLAADEGALESEADDIKSKYKDRYDAQVENLRLEQQEYQKEQLLKQKTFENNITKVIEDNSEFDDKRKKFIKNSIFKFKTLDDGTKVNDFYIKFAEWQNNPSSYIELAEFIMDKEGYLKRKSIEVENKVVEKTFNFVKGNTSLSKNKGSRHLESDTSSSNGTDFSVVFK